jgi:hypothetical protein
MSLSSLCIKPIMQEVRFAYVNTIREPKVTKPCRKQVASRDDLNLSVDMIYNFVAGASAHSESIRTEDLVKPVANSVDVRDVARALAEVLKSDKSGGERFILANRSSFQSFGLSEPRSLN